MAGWRRLPFTPCRGVTSRLPSEKRSLCSGPATAPCARSRAGSTDPQRQSLASCGGTPRREAEAWSTEPRPRNGTLTGERDARRARSWLGMPGCGGMYRTVWRAFWLPHPVRRCRAPRYVGSGGATAHGKTGAGLCPGALNRSRTGSGLTSRAWPSILAIRTALGSAAPTRTPTACSGSTFPKAPISANTPPRPNSPPSNRWRGSTIGDCSGPSGHAAE